MRSYRQPQSHRHRSNQQFSQYYLQQRTTRGGRAHWQFSCIILYLVVRQRGIGYIRFVTRESISFFLVRYFWDSAGDLPLVHKQCIAKWENFVGELNTWATQNNKHGVHSVGKRLFFRGRQDQSTFLEVGWADQSREVKEKPMKETRPVFGRPFSSPGFRWLL